VWYRGRGNVTHEEWKEREDRTVQHCAGVIKFATQRAGCSVQMKSTCIPVELQQIKTLRITLSFAELLLFSLNEG